MVPIMAPFVKSLIAVLWQDLQQLGVALGPGAVVCLVPRMVPLAANPRVTAVPALWL